jgi:aminoglycoside phosphotransferase (APT) family kinase protein
LLPLAVEANVREVAADHGVPVPRVIHVGEPGRDFPADFLISEAVSGETIPRRVLRLTDEHHHLGSRLTAQLGDALACLHHARADLIPSLERVGTTPAAHAFGALDARWRRRTNPSAVFGYALRWLESRLPQAAASESIVHGDVRTGNIVVDSRGLVSILDWESAHLGDPMEDIAWLCLRTWRFGADRLTVGGFGSTDVLRRAYERSGGVWRSEDLRWWSVLLSVKWGLDLGSQARAFSRSPERSLVLAASGRRVPEIEYDILSLTRPRGDAS